MVRVRQRFVEQGLEAVLERWERLYRSHLVDGEVEARIIALRCSPPSEGYARWTLRLLVDRLVDWRLSPLSLTRRCGRF